MRFLYNTLQLLLFPVLFTVLCLSKNRPQNLVRLGLGFHCRPKQIGRKTFWIYADSASEISSSLILIKGLKQTYPGSEILFSTTIDNEKAALNLLADTVDGIIPFPLDFSFVVNKFLRLIEPDLVILVNTHSQLTFPGCLRAKKIPVLLANCRISSQNNKLYRRFAFVFEPLFSCISKICVQTDNDRQKLIQLGVNQDCLHTSGNLKFDSVLCSSTLNKHTIAFSLPEHKQLLVAGATHEGEEETILQCFIKLRMKFPDLYLIIAPHNSKRGRAIHRLAGDMGLTANLRSQINAGGKDLFILDSSFELDRAYRLGSIIFVGGSMVAAGGHNPVEPAIYGIPVLFGQHMGNYFDISGELLQSGGGIMVRDQIELMSNLEALLKNQDWLLKKGTAAREYCRSKQGVIARHLSVIQKMF